MTQLSQMHIVAPCCEYSLPLLFDCPREIHSIGRTVRLFLLCFCRSLNRWKGQVVLFASAYRKLDRT